MSAPQASGLSPRARALADTIRYAEGTWHGGGERGYGTIFGGGQFDWRQGHPNRVVRTSGYASAAAGAYQFMPATWNEITAKLGMDPRDFSPAAQDRAAMGLVRRRGADPDAPMDAAMLNKLAPEWASLPMTNGQSRYGQPVKRHDDLYKFYQNRLTVLQQNPGNSPGQTPVAAAGTTPGGSAAGGTATGGASPPSIPLITGAGASEVPLTLPSSGGGSPAALSAALGMGRVEMPGARLGRQLQEELQGGAPLIRDWNGRPAGKDNTSSSASKVRRMAASLDVVKSILGLNEPELPV